MNAADIFDSSAQFIGLLVTGSVVVTVLGCCYVVYGLVSKSNDYSED